MHTAAARPGNDVCSNSIDVSSLLPYTAQTSNESEELGIDRPPACGRIDLDAEALWYSFTPNERTVLQVMLPDASFNFADLGFSTGTCDSLVCVAGEDFLFKGKSVIFFLLRQELLTSFVSAEQVRETWAQFPLKWR